MQIETSTTAKLNIVSIYRNTIYTNTAIDHFLQSLSDNLELVKDHETILSSATLTSILSTKPIMSKNTSILCKLIIWTFYMTLLSQDTLPTPA